MKLKRSERDTLRMLLDAACLVRRTGPVLSALANHLDRLTAEGLVTRDAAGFYSLTEAGRVEAEK